MIVLLKSKEVNVYLVYFAGAITRKTMEKITGWQKLRDRLSPKSQGLLRKVRTPNIHYFVAKISIVFEVFYRAFNETHPAFGELLMKVSLLLKGF